MKRFLAWLRRTRCDHQWGYSGLHGTGWIIARCALCGEMDLA